MKHIRSLSLTTALTIWLITALTILGELSAPFKNFLASLTGHHWVTKSIVSVVFFFLVYLLLARSLRDYAEQKSGATKVILSAVLGGLTILIFYIWHYLG